MHSDTVKVVLIIGFVSLRLGTHENLNDKLHFADDGQSQWKCVYIASD